MQIRCLGYVDEEVTSLKRVAELMDSIMNGSIERPEFEVVVVKDEEEQVIRLAALFAEGDGHFVGWIVSKRTATSSKSEVFCDENISGSERVQVLFCGAPEEVEESAILTAEVAGRLVSLLAEGRELVGYRALALSEVIS